MANLQKLKLDTVKATFEVHLAHMAYAVTRQHTYVCTLCHPVHIVHLPAVSAYTLLVLVTVGCFTSN